MSCGLQRRGGPRGIVRGEENGIRSETAQRKRGRGGLRGGAGEEMPWGRSGGAEKT